MFSVSNIVDRGRSLRICRSAQEDHQDISEISIGIPFIANFENDEETRLSRISAPRSMALRLTLKARLRPFTQKSRSHARTQSLKDVDLTRIDEYSPSRSASASCPATLIATYLLTFTQVDGQAPNMVFDGPMRATEVEIENRAVEVPYTAKLEQLDLKLTEINLNGLEAFTYCTGIG